MTQCERILQHMTDYGGISSLDAFRDLGCTRLGSRIHELRRRGYSIKSECIVEENRYGEKVRFKRYSLDGNQ